MLESLVPAVLRSCAPTGRRRKLFTMKYFLDTEFHEDGKTIDLISIGIVAEDGREFYAVNAEADYDRIWTEPGAAWVRENVMPQIDRSIAMSRAWIAQNVVNFVSSRLVIERGTLSVSPIEPIEFWGYYADYDWVAFCQLFGRMIDLPKHFPKYCRDIKQLLDSFADPCGNLPKLPPCENEHHALADARWNKKAYEYLTALPSYLSNVVTVNEAKRILGAYG